MKISHANEVAIEMIFHKKINPSYISINQRRVVKTVDNETREMLKFGVYIPSRTVETVKESTQFMVDYWEAARTVEWLNGLELYIDRGWTTHTNVDADLLEALSKVFEKAIDKRDIVAFEKARTEVHLD